MDQIALSDLDIAYLSERLGHLSTEEILMWVWETFGPKVAVSSSFQTQSVPLLHIISRVCPEIPVIFIDTGFHFPETLVFRDELQKQYNLNIIVVCPEIDKTRLLEIYGEQLPSRDPDLCCQINKVEPLQRTISGMRAWVSGIRHDQTAHRRNLSVLAPQSDGLLKVHPMINWTKKDIWKYINKYDLPSHPLFSQGYLSIGCQPCSRPVFKGEGERAGRWLSPEKVECGLHEDWGKAEKNPYKKNISHSIYTKKEKIMKTAKLGNRIIGDGYPCFISLEPGATHTGLDSAKQLAKAAAEAGADAVKFQTVDADELMSSEEIMVEYETPEGKRKESVYQALKRRELTFDEWRALKAYCDDLGLLFISCPSGPGTVELLSEIGVAAIKVAKSDINNKFLIRLIAEKKLPVIMDAREKFEEVESGIRILEEAEIEDIIIMHCPSGYPVEHAGIHLKAIPHIKNIFGYPVGYSDHSKGDYMNYAALGIGANFIEKTITLNKTTNAVEHYMSLEPHEIRQFIQNIRNIEEAFGNPRVIFSSRVNAKHRRSIMAARTIKKGEVITLDALAFKRPGTYLSVARYEEVVGKRATHDLEEGIFLEERDFE